MWGSTNAHASCRRQEENKNGRSYATSMVTGQSQSACTEIPDSFTTRALGTTEYRHELHDENV